MQDRLLELAKKEIGGGLFGNLKVEIVKQSLPSLFVCCRNPMLVADQPRFAKAIVEGTRYDLKTFLPMFILNAIIIAVVEWLIKKWLNEMVRRT